MSRNYVRGAVLTGLLAASTVLVGIGPAQAIPPAGEGESVTFTYYSDATRTVEVGWRSYGDCGEPYDIGTHTRYYSIRYVTCY